MYLAGKSNRQEVRNEVQQLRKSHDMTQQQLAESLGVTRQTIISIEKGKYTPSLPLALKVARVFKTSVEDIFSL